LRRTTDDGRIIELPRWETIKEIARELRANGSGGGLKITRSGAPAGA